MKKQIFTLSLLVIFTQAFTQNSLRERIQGERGVSKKFITFNVNEQISFSPSQVRNIFDLDPNSDLVLMSKEQDRLGFIHYRYYQTYRGIPVENTMYVVHTKDGRLAGMNGAIVTDFDTQMDNRSFSSLNSKKAIDVAVNHVNAAKYMWQDDEMEQRIKAQSNDARATYYPTATLVWYNDGEDISPRELRLAYKVDVYAKQPISRAYYFVDAQTGKVLGSKDELFFSDATGTANTAYSGAQTIHSDLNGASYRLRDLTKGNGVITLHGESGQRGTDYTSASANWTLTGTNIAALDAHYGVSQTYDFYKTVFNRNSYNNQGTALTSYVNDPTYTDNAFWDGSAMNFNKRSNSATYPGGVTGIDVTGHELTHGVTQTTSGLNYSKEPGAMNESMSDIMGKSVQFWSKPSDVSWLMSNDMNWIIRDMSNPNAQGQPDTYLGSYWTASSADNYGVHTNSGVGNFMFYLLVTGGSGTNDIGNAYTVTGIGLAKADQILYRSETAYLVATSKYADWRTACINAATDLYGAGSNEVSQVQNAWYAVGIGTAAGGGGACNIPAGLAANSITSTGAALSWASTGATTYNLQWKTTAAATWTTVSGLVSPSYNLTGLTASTSYQFQVQSACTGGVTSAYSSPFSFTTAASGGITYCTSKGTTAYEYINKVVLGSISNTSGNNSGYADYTGLSTNLTAGSSYTISLTPGFTGSTYRQYWTVFIDYNQNGTLNNSGETIATVNGTGAVSKSFTVPASAKNGATRMRIVMHYGSSRTNPCGSFSSGEVEDYTVNISGGSGFAGIVAANDGKSIGVKITPNPVSGSSATVSYKLAQDGKVTLKVIDMFGRNVQNINLGNQSAGAYTYVLTGTKKINSGNYFIVVEQNNQAISRTKFIVTR